MPRPVYIICCESGVVDNVTNLTSYFNVFDTLKLTLVATPAGTPPVTERMKFRTSAVWMREEADCGNDFEHRFLLFLPGTEQVEGREIALTPFSFDCPFQRFDVILHGPAVPRPGLLRIRSQVKRAGAAEWPEGQEYPIRVEVTQQAEPAAQ